MVRRFLGSLGVATIIILATTCPPPLPAVDAQERHAAMLVHAHGVRPGAITRLPGGVLDVPEDELTPSLRAAIARVQLRARAAARTTRTVVRIVRSCRAPRRAPPRPPARATSATAVVGPERRSAPPAVVRPHPLPADWQPSRETIEAYREKGIDAFGSLERFRNHWSSIGSKRVNWEPGFKNWVDDDIARDRAKKIGRKLDPPAYQRIAHTHAL